MNETAAQFMIRDVSAKTPAAYLWHSIRLLLTGMQRIRADSGSLSVACALALPALFAAVALGVDFGHRNMIKTELQAAADSAATSAAKELSVAGVPERQIDAVAKAFASRAIDRRNGPFSTDIRVDRKLLRVTVTVQQKWTPFFAHFLDAGITPVIAKSVAQFGGTTNVCVLALNPSNSGTIAIKKMGKLRGDGCTVYANSNDAKAISLEESATMEAELICSAGGAIGKKAMYVPQPLTDCPVFRDPLAKRSPPRVDNCDYHSIHIRNQAATLSPGVYCNGITISGTAKVSFEPGVYVVKDKAFLVQDTAQITGTNVAFYLTGKSALLDFRENTTIRLSGREDGELASVLFFEDRSSPLGRTHRINSAHAEILTGTIYLPRGKLRIDPNAEVASESAYTALIVWQLELDYGPTLVLHSDYGNTNVPVAPNMQAPGSVLLIQ